LQNVHFQTLVLTLPPLLCLRTAGSAKTATAASILNGKGAVSYVKATPAQFHFHSHSEHVMSGAEYPLEMHIVHFIKPDQLPSCPAPGCPAVVGVMLALTDKEDEVRLTLFLCLFGVFVGFWPKAVVCD
jgi:hypothetical protein